MTITKHGGATCAVRTSEGFTLIEVLVALVIAAILASGLLALQQHGLNQARRADVLWVHLNTAQEALMGQELGAHEADVQIASRGIFPAGSDVQDVRITTQPPSLERPSPWVSLTTRLEGVELEWSWPAPAP